MRDLSICGILVSVGCRGSTGESEVTHRFSTAQGKVGLRPVIVQGSTVAWHLGSELRLPPLKILSASCSDLDM